MKQDHILLKFSILEPAEQVRIKEALRLLILIFWSQGGEKDWTALVRRSEEIWKSLSVIPELGNQAIANTADKLLQSHSPEFLDQELESEFIRIFINTRKGVAAPLYHSCYHNDQYLLMKEPSIKMAEILETAGMDVGPEIGEPPDHISIELEYLYFLLNQEQALNDPEFSSHIRGFALEFMLPWIDEFQSRIPADGVSVFFTHSARAMKQLVGFIGERHTPRT